MVERLSEAAVDILNELHTERLDYTSEYVPLIGAALKLQDYEDTGLSPAEIKSLQAEWSVNLKALEHYKSIAKDSLALLKDLDDQIVRKLVSIKGSRYYNGKYVSGFETAALSVRSMIHSKKAHLRGDYKDE